jgi:dihydrofolate reductase
LYSATLALPPSAEAAFVDRILLTRIISPLFEQCDVYIPNFLENAIIDGEEVNWQRASHSDLQAWAGFVVPEGVQQENGVEYEFQMWVRGC